MRIIEYAVLEVDPIQITQDRIPDKVVRKKERERPEIEQLRTQPALARVSRGLRVDALKAYYKLNQFRASYCCGDQDQEQFLGWLEAIGPTNRGHMLHLRIYDEMFEGLEDYKLPEMDDETNMENFDNCFFEVGGELSAYGAEVGESFYDKAAFPERQVKFAKKI